MKNNNMVLLKTLLLSTSQINIWKHTSDKKKKSKNKRPLKKGDIVRILFLKKNKDYDPSQGAVYEKDGKKVTLKGDYVISSMPIKDLVAAMNDVPTKYAKIAAGLPYRDYMTVGVLINKLNLKIETKASLNTPDVKSEQKTPQIS